MKKFPDWIELDLSEFTLPTHQPVLNIRDLKGTCHSMIFDIPCVKIKDTDDVLSIKRRPATPVMVIIPLNFARCTLPTHRNREVKSRLKQQDAVDGQAIEIGPQTPIE